MKLDNSQPVELTIPGHTSPLLYFQKIGSKLGRINIYLFFLLLFIYQVLMVLQGIDLLDEGFHTSSYQQIFRDPESVQYTLLYYFADIAGGVVMKVFPGSGLLGIRIAGAVISTLTIVIAYLILKKHIRRGNLLLSLTLLALFINNDPKDLYYNNFSAFLYLISIYFLYNGLIKNKNLFVFVSGLVIGMNVFTKLPNALAPGIGVSILIYGYYQVMLFSSQIKKLFYFIFGCLAGILIILGLMHFLGHYDYFISSIRQLSTISSGANDKDGLAGSYGPLSIIIKPVKQYFQSIGLVINVFSVIIICSFLLKYVRDWHKLFRILFNWLILAIFLYFINNLVRQGIQNYELIDLFTGLSLCAALFIFFRTKSNEIRLICLMGAFLVLIHPIGSAIGIYTVVPYSLWLTFPFAVDLIASTQHISFDIKIDRKKGNIVVPITINERSLGLIKLIGLLVIIASCLWQIIAYPYFYDQHNRLDMTYQVNNKFMRGIYTSRERAECISELLKESEKYIHAGDYVLAYDMIPMYHFWTETRPFLRNPAPWFYSSSSFKYELDRALIKAKRPPPVVMQTALLIGEGSKWPEMNLNRNYSDFDRNRARTNTLNQFLNEYHYRIVWENKVFRILIPDNR